jgi:hypothetical protein
MPYGVASAYRCGNRLTIEVELPKDGELSQRGRSANLVDPREWIEVAGDGDLICVKLTVCRPIDYARRTRAFRRDGYLVG